jgi:gluconolactonase
VTRDDKAYMSFTDDPIAEHYAHGSGIPSQLPDAVWRFDPQERTLVPVISQADLLIPKGIRANASQTKAICDRLECDQEFPDLARRRC